MKTIGMIGGMSWESSLEYYRIINEAIKQQLGGLQHSAKSAMVSVDFAEIEVLQRENRWQDATRLMTEAARAVEAGGADFLIICTNTMHKMADEVQKSVSIPLLHIADATAAAIQAQGLQRVGLLGTRFTMEQDFYRGRLAEKYGLDVLVPDRADREIVHRVIYGELVLGKTMPASKVEYQRIIAALAKAGAGGSSWVAPKSGCWFPRLIVLFRCSIPPAFMPWRRSGMLCRFRRFGKTHLHLCKPSAQFFKSLV